MLCDGGSGNDLVIVAAGPGAGEQLGGSGLDDLNNLSGDLSGLAQDVGDGFTDDGEQGEQNEQVNLLL